MRIILTLIDYNWVKNKSNIFQSFYTAISATINLNMFKNYCVQRLMHEVDI